MSDINEKSNFVFEFQPVTKLFEEQVRLHPDKCAVASSKEMCIRDSLWKQHYREMCSPDRTGFCKCRCKCRN